MVGWELHTRLGGGDGGIGCAHVHGEAKLEQSAGELYESFRTEEAWGGLVLDETGGGMWNHAQQSTTRASRSSSSTINISETGKSEINVLPRRKLYLVRIRKYLP